MASIVQLKKQLAAAEKRIKDLKAENETIRVEAEKKEQEKDEEINKISREKWRYIDELDQEHKNRVSDWKMGEKERKKQQQEWLKEKEQLEKQNDLLSYEIHQLQEEMVPKIWLTGSNKEFFALVGDFNAANAELKEQLKDAELKNQEFVKDRREKKRELEKFMVQMINVEAENTSLKNSYWQWVADKSKLEKSKEEVASLKQKLGNVLNQNEQLRRRIELLDMECRKEMEKMVATFESLRSYAAEEMTKWLDDSKKKLEGVEEVKTTEAYKQWSMTFAKVVLECHGRFATPYCKICGFDYSDELVPKVLDCGHSVCVQCAEKLVIDGRQIACPFDRLVTRMDKTRKTAKDLPTNFELMDALDVRIDGLKMIGKSFAALESSPT